MSHPHTPGGRLADQDVREVGARELRHHAASIIRSVADGERTIVTRHGEPRAVMLSIDDALDLLVEPWLPALAQQAEREYAEEGVERLEPCGRFPVALASEAAGAYESMSPRDRRELRLAVAAGEADEERPVWLRSRRWIASVAYPDHRTVLVCAIFAVQELERELIGEEIWLRRARRDLERRLHARDLAGLPT